MASPGAVVAHIHTCTNMYVGTRVPVHNIKVFEIIKYRLSLSFLKLTTLFLETVHTISAVSVNILPPKSELILLIY